MITAGPEYAPALAAIHAAAFGAAEAWNAGFFASQLAMAGHVALLDDEGRGFILLRVIADEAEVLTIAVVPECQRRGIGRSLMANGLAAVAALGARSSFLEVSVRKPGALALYQGFGFIAVGRRKAYYPDGADALLLRREEAKPARVEADGPA